MTPSYSARILLCSVAVVCAFSPPKASAQLDPDLLAWEPFDYPTAPSGSALDRNNDGNVDLWGLNGGFGFGGAWFEANLGTAGDPLDYIQPLSLGVPASSAGLLATGGSLRSYMSTSYRGTFLDRTLANPIATTDGTTLWISIFVKKERVHSNLTEDTAAGENFIFSLRNSPGPTARSVEFGDASGALASPFNYFLRSDVGAPSLDFAERGPVLREPDLLVLKLSFLADSPDTVELFLNPTLGVIPTIPNALIELDGKLSDIASIHIGMDGSTWRTEWSFDEIRIGKTYNSVTPSTIPEPSSVLLAGFGLGAAGFTRLRRNRAA